MSVPEAGAVSTLSMRGPPMGERVVDKDHPSFIFGYAMKHPKAKCRGAYLVAGDLRVGKVICFTPKSRMLWRHWDCITYKFIRALKRYAADASTIEGFDQLTCEDQEKVKSAWQDGYVIPEHEGNLRRQLKSPNNRCKQSGSDNSESSDDGSPSGTSHEGDKTVPMRVPYTMKSLLSPPRRRRKMKRKELNHDEDTAFGEQDAASASTSREGTHENDRVFVDVNPTSSVPGIITINSSAAVVPTDAKTLTSEGKDQNGVISAEANSDNLANSLTGSSATSHSVREDLISDGRVAIGSPNNGDVKNTAVAQNHTRVEQRQADWSTFKFADEEEERDWKLVVAYYNEYPDPLPFDTAWNAYHMAQYYASQSVPLGRKWSWMAENHSQYPSIAAPSHTQPTAVYPSSVAQFTNASGKREAPEAAASEPPKPKRRTVQTARKSTGGMRQKMKSVHRPDHPSSNYFTSSESSSFAHETHATTSDLMDGSQETTTPSRMPSEQRESISEYADGSSSQTPRFKQMARRAISTTKKHKPYQPRQQYQELKKDREMVIQTLQAHAQPEEQLKSAKSTPEPTSDSSVKRPLQTARRGGAVGVAFRSQKRSQSRQAYEELKNEREMVIQTLQAHAQQEEDLLRAKRVM
ncbi:hypothetical protein H0H93_006440 [Arthromyces matolae]|nr:hypothetical protein H0H93_006440 [Arthromyces matolae]